MCCIKSECKGTAFATLGKTFLQFYLLSNMKNHAAHHFHGTQASFLPFPKAHEADPTACRHTGVHATLPHPRNPLQGAGCTHQKMPFILSRKLFFSALGSSCTTASFFSSTTGAALAVSPALGSSALSAGISPP